MSPLNSVGDSIVPAGGRSLNWGEAQTLTYIWETVSSDLTPQGEKGDYLHFTAKFACHLKCDHIICNVTNLD